MTYEDAAMAGRFLGAARVERAHDLQRPQRRAFPRFPVVGGTSADVRLQKRFAESLGHRVGLHDEGGANLVHAGLERHPDHPVVVEGPPRHRGRIGNRIAVGVNHSRWTGRPRSRRLEHLAFDVEILFRRGGQREHMNPLAIDADLEVLLADEMRDVGIDPPPDPRLDVVLAGPGDEIVDLRAAAGSRRHALEAHILIELVRDAEQIAVGRRSRAEREARHLLRGVEIALGQERRQLQDPGDVVEAVAHFVGRQQRRRVDLESQQIADRILVFGAIQAMERLGAARIGIGLSGEIERRLDRCGEFIDRRLRRPADAGGRHQAGAELDDDLLPFRRVGRDIGDVQGIQRQSAGLEPLVVARHAIGVDERLGGRRRSRGWRHRRGLCAGGGHRRQATRRRRHSPGSGTRRRSMRRRPIRQEKDNPNNASCDLRLLTSAFHSYVGSG